ncbi:NADPH:quinone reductase-like Zn-dependent oxidoreductase [Streptomyces griseochromogenes]|uniref:NADPH:quinone reductase n=1 Tax=Streptomyces griseochromogenes TaxID=68214 RepID=A0A1B1ASU4_9ACTN|nr:zinc-dependent alcohol dehydrogenase family protein [Streptomyces griseochromogenes]ANP49592.1 NADPH:quinone reductase [Streptomyces griseochromogenes]MBP2051954.1 NADPH:quinone reductase-like Zn-dependent oxidoreductase [Streptomyces griseochromogenes]
MTTSARTVLFHELGGPDVLTVEEVELPDPGPGEVLVKVEALGLNRAEAMLRSGTYFYQPTLPGSRNGYEAAGEVAAVGAGVTAFAPGDPVLTAANFNLSSHGVYGDLVLLPETSLVPRPAGVDAVTAAAVWLTYSTAYGALVQRAGLAAGDRVLITGASSGVGTAAIQVARRAGAVPIAATRTEAKRRTLLDLGAEHVIVTDREDMVKETRRLTDGRGADIVLDAIGGPVFRELGGAAAEDATMISYGWLSEQPIELPRNWPVTVHGYSNLAVTGTADGRRRAAHYIGSGLTDGTLRPVVGEVFEGLDRTRDAHRLMESNRHTGKIVVRV